jgi:rare lipoprotein A
MSCVAGVWPLSSGVSRDAEMRVVRGPRGRKVHASTWAASLALAALCIAAALYAGHRASPYLPRLPLLSELPLRSTTPAWFAIAERIAHVPLEPWQRPNRAKKEAREPVRGETARLIEARVTPELASPDAWEPVAPKDEAESSAAAEAPQGEEGVAGETGRASWYALASLTASGEMMDASALTAAHRTLPLGSYARVENLDNGRSVLVRINDRGPFAKNRIIDLSKAAAHELDMVEDGVAKVRVRPVPGADVAGN